MLPGVAVRDDNLHRTSLLTKVRLDVVLLDLLYPFTRCLTIRDVQPVELIHLCHTYARILPIVVTCRPCDSLLMSELNFVQGNTSLSSTLFPVCLLTDVWKEGPASCHHNSADGCRLSLRRRRRGCASFWCITLCH